MARQEYFKFVSAVHMLLIRDGKVLLLRRFNTGWKDGYYSLIAGHIDGNETAKSAAVREIKEESGLKITTDYLEFCHVMHRFSVLERIDFFFRVKRWKDEPRNTEPEKCDDMQWFPIESLPENTVPYIKFAIESIRAGITYSEFEEDDIK